MSSSGRPPGTVPFARSQAGSSTLMPPSPRQQTSVGLDDLGEALRGRRPVQFERAAAVPAQREQAGVAHQQDPPVRELRTAHQRGGRPSGTFSQVAPRSASNGRRCRACRRPARCRRRYRCAPNHDPAYGELSRVQVAPPSSDRASVPDSPTSSSAVTDLDHLRDVPVEAFVR